jgi:uncharacterized OB-fold protein
MTGIVEGRPLPVANELTQAFWDGCREHRLLVQECARCGDRFFVPEPICPACWSAEWRWAPSPGVGTVYTFTVVYRPAHPDLDAPYAVIAVDLDDGWTMMSNLVGCPPEDVHIGQRVTVDFRTVGDATLPFFVPLADEKPVP